jgi:CxxC motif-containing protein
MIISFKGVLIMDKEKKVFPCVVCPVGCELEVVIDNGKVTGVTGNKCKRGEVYGKTEAENPVRILTSTIRVKSGVHPVCPVRTDGVIPKDKIFPCMKKINRIEVEAPIMIGQKIIENIEDTGVNVIASRSLPADKPYKHVS